MRPIVGSSGGTSTPTHRRTDQARIGKFLASSDTCALWETRPHHIYCTQRLLVGVIIELPLSDESPREPAGEISGRTPVHTPGADILSSGFEPALHAHSNVLTCCDMRTGPDGELVLADQRVAEIQHRYDPGHPVSRSIQRATPMILRAVEQVHGRTARTTSVSEPVSAS